jgi:hypothetical protein
MKSLFRIIDSAIWRRDLHNQLLATLMNHRNSVPWWKSNFMRQFYVSFYDQPLLKVLIKFELTLEILHNNCKLTKLHCYSVNRKWHILKRTLWGYHTGLEMGLGTGRHCLLSYREFHIEEAILSALRCHKYRSLQRCVQKQIYEPALQQFPFVGHSLGLLLLIWNVNLVLENHLHSCLNPSILLKMKENHEVLPRSYGLSWNSC